MSQDMLGALLRVLVSVPMEYLGALIDLCRKLSGSERPEWFDNLKRLLRKEPCWNSTTSTPVAWTDGNIHFTVTSNGMTREQWECHLESRGFRLSGWARNVLRCASDASTNGVAYHIVVRPGSKVAFLDCITKKIRVRATEKGWKIPHWEVACLIRDTFSDEQLEKMGLWWIATMHEPIIDSDGVPRLLYSSRDDGGRWLYAYYGRPDGRWSGSGGFAFVVSQVGHQN